MQVFHNNCNFFFFLNILHKLILQFFSEHAQIFYYLKKVSIFFLIIFNANYLNIKLSQLSNHMVKAHLQAVILH